jgi:hypothetical protein
MSLEFQGGSGRVTVRGEDYSFVDIDGCVGLWGCWNVDCIEEVQQRPEDTALGYAGVDW